MTEDEVLQGEPPLTPSVTPGQHDVTHRVTPAGHLAPHSTRAGSGGGGGGCAWVWVAEAEGWLKFGTELSFTGHGISRIANFLYQAICKRRGVECLGGADDSRVILEGTGGRWVGARGRRVSLQGCLAWRGRGSLRGHLRLLHKHTQTIPEDVRQTWSTYAKTVTLGTRALSLSFFLSLFREHQEAAASRLSVQVPSSSSVDQREPR